MAEWLGSADAATTEEMAATEETAEADPEEGYSQLQEAFAPDGGTVEGTAEETTVPATDRPEVTAPDQTDATMPDQPETASEPSKQLVKQASKQKVLGIIQISKIKVKAPIVEGVRSSNLKAGVGHIPGTAALGQTGNSALAGHRSYTFGKFFNRLDELAEGDEIIITTKKEELKYKVYKILVVTPDDVSVLKGSKDDNIITLITCTPIYVASHRLIVHARLVDETLRSD